MSPARFQVKQMYDSLNYFKDDRDGKITWTKDRTEAMTFDEEWATTVAMRVSGEVVSYTTLEEFKDVLDRMIKAAAETFDQAKRDGQWMATVKIQGKQEALEEVKNLMKNLL